MVKIKILRAPLHYSVIASSSSNSFYSHNICNNSKKKIRTSLPCYMKYYIGKVHVKVKREGRSIWQRSRAVKEVLFVELVTPYCQVVGVFILFKL